jgi:hypothetical protein
MESENISSRLREFLGDAACDLLREGKFEATMHRVVYGAVKPTERIEPFSVSGARPLTPEEASILRDSLLDEATWRWDLITRHRPIPEVLFKLDGASQHAIFVLDRNGFKLGFLRNLEIRALDFDPESRGAQELSRIVDKSGATK